MLLDSAVLQHFLLHRLGHDSIGVALCGLPHLFQIHVKAAPYCVNLHRCFWARRQPSIDNSSRMLAMRWLTNSHVCQCDPCRYNTVFLSQMFRIRQQRVMAILALKEIELVRGLQRTFALHQTSESTEQSNSHGR